jgi:RNA polymerase sigma-70 factor (ECF subfamily)
MTTIFLWLLKKMSEQRMTQSEYGCAYLTGHIRTNRFLISRGMSWDSAEETSQAAWVRGWEKIDQLRDSKMVLTWVNTIALNLYRNGLREPLASELPETAAIPGLMPGLNPAYIDLQRVMKVCKKNDRMILWRHYFEGYKVREIANAHGCSETAVRIRLFRARRAIAKRLSA